MFGEFNEFDLEIGRRNIWKIITCCQSPVINQQESNVGRRVPH